MIVFVFLAAIVLFVLILLYWMSVRYKRWNTLAEEEFSLRNDLGFFLEKLSQIYSRLPVMQYDEGDEWKAGSPSALNVQTRHYEKMRSLWKKANNSLETASEIFSQFTEDFGLSRKGAGQISAFLKKAKESLEILDSELREYKQLYPSSPKET